MTDAEIEALGSRLTSRVAADRLCGAAPGDRFTLYRGVDAVCVVEIVRADAGAIVAVEQRAIPVTRHFRDRAEFFGAYGNSIDWSDEEARCAASAETL